MRTALALAVILTVLLSIPVCAHFSGVKICIDPGHGGSDPGAVGQGLHEADINLDISLRARDLMQLDAATVVMTRTTDVYVSLQGRCDIANNAGAARFICSHCNAFNGSAYGTETYCHPNDSSTAYDLRNKVQAEMVAHMGTTNRGGKTNTFYVLSYTNMAAILAEVAFIDNAGDAAKLGNPAYRQAAANAYLHGLQSNYGQATHDVGTTPALDSTYHAQSYQATMMAGTTATVWVEYNNTGTETWTNSGSNPVRLGASNPQERSSAFYTAGDWIGPNRPTNMDQASCAPGGVARFSFTMTAPQTPGTYTEYWRLLKEGTAWFGYSGVYFTINVTPALGSISGTIRNANSANPISGASVSLNTGPSTQTNALGVYSFSNLAAQPYTVTASAPGYASNTAPAVVTAGNPTTANINLTPTDTQAPTTPTNLAAATESSTQINLTWTASTDNVGVVGYKVYRGGSQVGTATTNSYADNGVSPNTLYSYQVRAYDLAENISGLSNTATATTLVTTVAVFQDGFPDLNGWTPDVVIDGSTRGVAWNTSHNHGDFTGTGNAETLIGGGADPTKNGCWSYKSFPRPFAAGRYEGWFYDTSANNNSRQGIHLRGYHGTSLAFSIYIGTYSGTSFGNYCVGVFAGSWLPWTSIAPRSIGWHKFTIEVLPYTGSNDMKFYVDNTLMHTTNRPAATNTYGISKTYLGFNNNVNQSGWFDDLGFYADPPLSPTITAPTALTTTSIKWNYTDNSDKEAGFDLHDAAQTQKGTTGMNTSFITESGLVANTRYTRHVHGYNGTLDSAQSLDASAYTLSVPPTSSNVTCLGRTSNTAYGTPGFAFGAVGGFGAVKVEYYRVAWNQSASYTWTGSETQWGSGDLAVTATSGGNWYLHAKGYNGDGIGNGALDLGPYVYDATPPSPPTVSDDGQYTGSTSQLHASWTGAEDPESAVVKYYYQIGTDPGSHEIADWTEATSTSVTRSDLSLEVGSTYYFSVKAENAVGLVGGIGMSDGIMVVQTVASVSEAKAFEDGTLLALDGNTVSANFTDHFYIEASNRLSGLLVDAPSPEEGRLVSVAGRLDTVGGERVLTEATVFTGDLAGAPSPLHMQNRTLGGSGVTGGRGINNIGLLVRATGTVTHADIGFCYIDDGSGIQDGSGYTGVKLDTTKLTILPTETQHVMATGISGVEMVGTDFIRVLKPRRDADVQIYP